MTDDVFLRTLFLNFMKDHRGIENAVPYKAVLGYLRQSLPDLGEREFRAFYSMDPDICSCKRGIYFIVCPEDYLEFKKYMRKKALPLFERVRRVRDAHPNIVPPNDVQMGLF